MVKLDAGAVARLLTGQRRRRGYIRGMPTFTLTGVKYEYLTPALEGEPDEVHSWEYGHWPRVEAAVPLQGGGTVNLYAEAMRWGLGQILTRWRDDEGHMHSAWLPKDNVRRLTASEWDIIEYHLCPPELRPIRWGKRLPGFLPE
ncbi:hypothetical protein ACIP9X_05575 [Arthrobacter sp. NPDC093125]|uniref:hypothetical protein n=1 Tax=Arthrobacter sp. NPDC093125 TaxID=3363944 RepID=UPI003814073F